MAIMKNVGWKNEGFQFKGIDANVAYQEMESVIQSQGTDYLPQKMVDYGKANVSSTWNKLCFCNVPDAQLADEMRRRRAADAIRNFKEVTVEIEETTKQETVIQEVQVMYETEGSSTYDPRQIVVTNVDKMEYVTKRAWKLLEDWSDTFEVVQDPAIVAIRQQIVLALQNRP